MLNSLRVLLSIFRSLFQWTSKEEENELDFGFEGYFFNPTFYISKNRVRFITRTVVRECRQLVLSSIDLESLNAMKPKLEMHGIKNLDIDADWPADPRYFMFKSKRYLTFNSGHFERPNKLYIQEISDDGDIVDKPIEVRFEHRREIEKNWGFFEKDEQLYTVYSVCPFRVLKVDVDFALREAVCYDHVSYSWNVGRYEKKYGELRGGCSPIKYGASYFFVVQSNVRILGKSIYTANLLQFDGNTFQPEVIGDKPIFLMTFRQIFQKPLKMLNKRVFTCIYPTGVQVIDDNQLLISFGINDYKSVIRKYKLANILASLSKKIQVLND